MINYITAPFKWFFKLEAASGLMLLIFAVVALVISNSNLSNYYFDTLNTHILVGSKISSSENELILDTDIGVFKVKKDDYFLCIPKIKSDIYFVLMFVIAIFK